LPNRLVGSNVVWRDVHRVSFRHLSPREKIMLLFYLNNVVVISATTRERSCLSVMQTSSRKTHKPKIAG
jgi:hypothetical protein